MTPCADPVASVVIVTRDRLPYVRRAIASAVEQSVALEILVVDDGSVDGTADALRKEFPDVRLEVSPTPRHQMAQRNRAMALASCAYVVMMDDDAYFRSPKTVEQTLGGFDEPRVGAVTIPYINVRREAFVRQAAPAEGDAWAVGVFAAGACAFRRSAFLAAGGYVETLVYQGEEGDLALRLIAAGHALRVGRADPMVHWEAQPQKSGRAQFYSARNEILLTWRAVPQPHLAPRLATVALRALLTGARRRRLRAALRGLMAGTQLVLSHREERAPVPVWAYRLTRKLRRRGPLPLDVAIARLETGTPYVR